MKLEFATFANAVDVSSNGMFHILGGGIDVLKSKEFPGLIHSLYVVAKVGANPGEFGSHLFICEVVGEDGQKIVRDLEQQFNIDPHPSKPNKGNWAVLTMHYMGLVFPKP